MLRLFCRLLLLLLVAPPLPAAGKDKDLSDAAPGRRPRTLLTAPPKPPAEGLWDAALGRRPYISEASADLLLHLGPATAGARVGVVARLPCVNRTWSWNLTGGADQILDLGPLADFPRLLNNDMIIAVSLDGAAPTEIRRRFMRAHRPDPAGTSQVDHHTAGLLVDGRQFAGAGWYVYQYDAFMPKDLQKVCRVRLEGEEDSEGGPPLPPGGYDQLWDCIRWSMGNMTANMSVMGREGVNMVMPYYMNPFLKAAMPSNLGPGRNSTELFSELVLQYFDAAHASGVKVMLDMSKMRINQGCAGCHGPNFQKGVLRSIRSSVELVKDHPALLGYYICDDCCTSHAAMAAQAQVYNTVKLLDPYHITIGAVFMGCVPNFNDVPSWQKGESDDAVEVLPGLETHGETASAVQPKTQLSLDFIMVENYGNTVDQHLKVDHRLRDGVRFEAVVNCPGSYTLEEHIKRRKPPALLQSIMWASLVAGGTANQLVFAGAAPDATNGVFGNGWHSKSSMMLFSQVGLYRAKLQVILPSLNAPFGFAHPSVAVANHTDLLPAARGMPQGKLLRARAWGQPRGSGDPWCGHLIVVSGLEHTASTFTLKLGGSFPTGGNRTALRLFDADYKVAIGEDGSMTDWIGPADTNIYELGDCSPPKDLSAAPLLV